MTAAGILEEDATAAQLPELSALLWLAVKTFFFTAAGALLAKRDILDSKGPHLFAKALFAIFYPALLLSKIATAVNPEDVVNAGMVVTFAVFYIAFGLLGGVAMRWMVKRKAAKMFGGGIFSSCMWGNWGDLPLAIVFSITEYPPVRPGESLIAVAYLEFFILAWNVGFIPLAAIQKPENDHEQENEKDQEKEKEEEMSGVPTHSTTVSRSEFSKIAIGSAVLEDGRKKMEREEENESEEVEEGWKMMDEVAKMTMTERKAREIEEGAVTSIEENSGAEDVTSVEKWRGRNVGGHRAPVAENGPVNFATVPNLAIVAGLVIGITPALRWAFIKDATNPDPPLKFLLDCCNFMGAVAVPLALVNLGAALYNLKIDIIFRKIVPCVAAFRLVVCPLIAILAARALVNIVVADLSDRTLMFVVIFMGCTPWATSNVFMTQSYKDKETGLVIAMLVARYMLAVAPVVVSLTVILHSLFLESL